MPVPAVDTACYGPGKFEIKYGCNAVLVPYRPLGDCMVDASVAVVGKGADSEKPARDTPIWFTLAMLTVVASALVISLPPEGPPGRFSSQRPATAIQTPNSWNG